MVAEKDGNEAARELLARAYSLANDDETRALYRDWAATYDATMLDGLGYLTPARTVAMLAAQMQDRSGPVLDVGSGTGLAGAELAKAGFTVVDALDYSAEMLAEAERRGVYRATIEADLNQPLPIEDDAYAALVSTGTFTHAHVGAACLDELFRVLRPGGLFACTVHKDVWEPSGFATKTAELAEIGRIETIFHEPGTYYADSTEPDGYYIVWRRPA